jgi:hypothetical protein
VRERTAVSSAQAPGEFIVGVNLPWIAYGGDFGANAWHPEGGVGSPAGRSTADDALRALAGAGVRWVRWFLLCDGRAGLVEDSRGRVVGLDGFVLRDVEVAVELATRHGLKVLFVLLDFKWFEPRSVENGVQLGGRSWAMRTSWRRSLFLDAAVTPILERVGKAEAVWGWDVINEPEWIMLSNRRLLGLPGWGLRGLARGVVERVAGLCRNQVVTVGLASVAGLDLVRGLGLDLYQWHWYDTVDSRGPLDTPLEGLDLDAPAILGEYPTHGSSRSPGAIVATARRAGYRGALAWAARLDDEHSDARVAMAAGSSAAGLSRRA